MIALLWFGCGPKVPPSTRPDSGDSARADTAPLGPDDDCDGRDDDGNGVVDDGAAPDWWADPTRWRTVATFEDAEEPRFVAALAAGSESTYALVQEFSTDYAEGALSVRAWDGAGAPELTRIEADGDGLPIGYAAAVDGVGALWIGGIRYDAGPGTRRLEVYRWDGALVAIPVDEERGSVRLYAGLGDDAGAWFGGYGAAPERSTPVWTLWYADGAGVRVEDSYDAGGDGRIEGLAARGAAVSAAGWVGDAKGAIGALLREGDGAGVYTTVTEGEGRYTGLATTDPGGHWLGLTDRNGEGWVVQDQDGVAVDTTDATVSLIAANGRRVWAAGTVTGSDGADVLVRSGDAAGFVDSLDTVAADGWTAEPHDLVVTPQGRVWLSITETALDGARPIRARLLHLDCRDG